MTVEAMNHHARSTVLFTLPTMLGYTMNLNAGTLMLVGGFLAWMYGQLIWRHGEARARAHKEWVLAENASIKPRMDMVEAERRGLTERVEKLEEQLKEAIAAERDLALVCLANSGDMTPRPKP